jgi:ArsR family transcriptional regulator
MVKHILAIMNMIANTVFTALAHPLRLRALLLLQQEGELCVCELTHALGVSQPMISRHLAQLRRDGLVSDRRQGLWVYYRLHDALPEWTRQVLADTADGVAGQAPYADDRAALSVMPNRPGSACCA